MKNAKLKLTDEAAASRGWKRVERDTMPPSVATDLLCNQNRLTNRMRKLLHAARATIFQSTATRVPVEVKLARRMGESTLGQLVKWSSRLKKKRRSLQNKYQKALEKLPDNPLRVRFLAALDLAAAGVDLRLDAVENEVTMRNKRACSCHDLIPT